MAGDPLTDIVTLSSARCVDVGILVAGGSWALQFPPPNKIKLRRFEQEAQAAAALNHPNIAHIYEIGESGGVNFMAMEFVDGVTLGEKIHGERTELKKLLNVINGDTNERE